ncbi:Aspartate/glutamate leucyltransferase [BD1-7 clade bacterium]|uniref:Aspartate/glutamate leucyltransferase n=1 Tax=BD1-7 clade bacterium TaxID=2029982 RepID=A0A5S9QP32_9GAMM|nr:Aspartate/glutamate leucyltransferase [BD1-7 clade bacterium]
MNDNRIPVEQLALYTTAPHACSYIEGSESTTLFVDPQAKLNKDAYSFLSERGFRRSGPYVYKPDCLNCQACIPIRIPVKDYQFSRNEKRILKRNGDLSAHYADTIATDELYRLYADYICQRHHDGDMYPPDKDQYESFLSDAFGCTDFVVFSSDAKPVAVAVIDQLRNGLSAIYTFYNPKEEKRSLGSFAILWQIQQAKEIGLDYLYLGYWIKSCAKMSYKTRYRPCEIYINQRWIELR